MLEREDHVFIRDLDLPVSIGIYDHEKQAPQRVLINIDMSVTPSLISLNDDHDNVVCYESVTNQAKELVARGHINLVETLAEDLANICLKISRVKSVQVRVEKPDIIPEASAVGVEITRFKTME